MLFKTSLMGFAFASSLAMADIEQVAVPDMERSNRADGWHQVFSGDLGLNLTDMDNVAGKKDGLNSTLNIGIKYQANLYQGSNELRNTVSISESLNRTPSYDGTVHANDELKLESIYLFNFDNLTWMSPYVSVVGTTNLFKAYDYQQTAKVYNDPTKGASVARNRYQLLEGFGVINLQETVGGLFKIHKSKDIAVEGRVGVGAKQIFADDQLSVIDGDAAVVQLNELSDVRMTGIEAGLEAKGVALGSRVEYTAYAKAFAPFHHSPETPATKDLDMGELTSTELGARLNFKLVDWASIVYEWKHLREPLLLDGPQITQNLLLNVGYLFDSRAEVN